MKENYELPTIYQQVIHKSRYARFNNTLQRREHWYETVERYIDFFRNRFSNNKKILKQLEIAKKYILELKVMPSMRCLMSAGTALERDNVAGYNCSYIPIDSPRAFDEIMYILLCGTGVGFSVESKYVNKLPVVAEEFHNSETTIIVSDSRIGWASAFRELISLLYVGKIPQYDTSRIRPAGSILKTFGGRASGPEPLINLFEYTIHLFKNAAGRKLTTLECHDLVCKIAEIVVVGGVRRSALISLTDLNDDALRKAKHGEWWREHPERALANISAVYDEKPTMEVFFEEWKSIYQSKSGERGIFSRWAAREHIKNNVPRRDYDYEFGCNPCSEIILRPYQFCNLTEVVVRPEDTVNDLKNKIKIATFLGCLQATLTDFRYLRKIWKTTTEEESLLGVSLTGILDGNKFITDSKVLLTLRETAKEEAKKWSKEVDINYPAGITCVKPSGTVSQLVDSASGLHPRWSKYYLRRIRIDKKDPISKFLKDQQLDYEDDIMKPNDIDVFAFPIESPDNAIYRNDFTAIQQLELWKNIAINYCEHKPSITVYVREHEWLGVGDWVFNNFEIMSGVSFLPYSDHVYRQAPYEEITEDQYKNLANKYSSLQIDWDKLKDYEDSDNTSINNELACTSGQCEL